MAIEVKLPELGENIETGDVTAVLVSQGEHVDQDAPLLELETDKAVVEVPAPDAGVVTAVHVAAGSTISVGDAIVSLEPDTADGADGAAGGGSPLVAVAAANGEAGSIAAEGAPAAATPPPGQVAAGAVPEAVIGDTGTAAAAGDPAAPGAATPSAGRTAAGTSPFPAADPLATGAAAAVSPPSGPAAASALPALPGASPLGAAAPPAIAAEPPSGDGPWPVAAQPSATGPEPPATGTAAAGAAAAGTAAADTEPPIPATPAVRRLAREIGVDLSSVHGSGAGGRIVADDVKATAKRLLQARAAGAAIAAGGAGEPLPDFARWGPIDRQPMNAVRRATAAHLSAAWQAVPAVTQQDKADITDLEPLRKAYGARTEAAGGKLTITAILVKVIASALKVFPQFNASVDLARNEVVYKRYCHVGVAVATERGLLVPVIRDADRKNIVQIAADLSELSARARARKLTAAEMQGGSFTISNLGGVGGSHFTPIVNLPEVAILGVSRAAREPVWQGEGFAPRLRLPLSLTYDHRLIDGVDGIRFLRWVIEALEQPLLLALEG